MKNIILQLFAIILVVITLHPNLANAEKLSMSDKITRNIKDICLAPSDKGKYWETSLKAGGETNVKLKFLGKASAEASFGIGEWNGVQRVLQSQQAHDNTSYRNCVKRLTPLFLDKFVRNKQPVSSAKPKNVLSESKLSVKLAMPILIYDSETKRPQRLVLIVVFVNSADYDLYPSEILMTGEIGQEHLVQIGNTKPKLALHVVGMAETSPFLKGHSSATLRYDLLDFSRGSAKYFEGYVGDSDKQETVKFTTSDPSIDDIIYKDNRGKLQLVNGFKDGTIRLTIDTGEERINVSPAIIMELAVINSKEFDDLHFMSSFVKKGKEKFRRISDIRKVNPKYE